MNTHTIGFANKKRLGITGFANADGIGAQHESEGGSSLSGGGSGGGTDYTGYANQTISTYNTLNQGQSSGDASLDGICGKSPGMFAGPTKWAAYSTCKANYKLCGKSNCPGGGGASYSAESQADIDSMTAKGYVFCGSKLESGGSAVATCSIPAGQTASIAYGAKGNYLFKDNQSGDVNVSYGMFGQDPAPGVIKAAYYKLNSSGSGSAGSGSGKNPGGAPSTGWSVGKTIAGIVIGVGAVIGGVMLYKKIKGHKAIAA